MVLLQVFIHRNPTRITLIYNYVFIRRVFQYCINFQTSFKGCHRELFKNCHDVYACRHEGNVAPLLHPSNGPLLPPPPPVKKNEEKGGLGNMTAATLCFYALFNWLSK